MSINLWDRGEVPYEIVIEKGLPARQRLEEAIKKWNDYPVPVKLVPRGPQHNDHVVFAVGNRSSSKRGRVGGRQEITLTPLCRRGVILHEIGHAVGMVHEHNRPDRDRYIERIVLDNVYRAALSNFQPRSPEGDDQLPYDFGSIMHYSQMAFSRNRGRTIVPRPEAVPPGTLIGQRVGLSDGDIRRLNYMYGGQGAGENTAATAIGGAS